MTLELCILCDEPTGRAGACEDSLFVDNFGDDLGPLCEDCYERERKAVEYERHESQQQDHWDNIRKGEQ